MVSQDIMSRHILAYLGLCRVAAVFMRQLISVFQVCIDWCVFAHRKEFCALQGDGLTCPAHGFTLGRPAPDGRLDGLMCYSASSSELITDATPMANITSMVYYEHHGLSSGAVAGIVILVLVLVAAMAGASQLQTIAFCNVHNLTCSWDACTG